MKRALIAIAALPACFRPTYDEPRCSGGVCPSGLACVAGYCVPDNAPVDAEVDPDASEDLDAAIDGALVVDASPIDGSPTDAPPPCPTGYTSGYRYVATHTTWLAAEADCENDQPGRTHLVVVDNQAEANALASMLAAAVEQELWIGIVRDPNPGGDQPPWTWRVVTGGNAPFTPWSPTQPDNGSGDQFVVRADKTTFQLFDRPVTDSTVPALCECDGQPAVNADYDPLTP